jgi:hypothetical protein
MRAAVCAMDFSTRPTRRAASGRTPLTDRPPTRSSWKGTASSAMSIVRGRRVARCRKRFGAPTTPNQKFARRACLRRAEGSDGFVHPDHRDRESEDEDRTGEPRLQYQTPPFRRTLSDEDTVATLSPPNAIWGRPPCNCGYGNIRPRAPILALNIEGLDQARRNTRSSFPRSIVQHLHRGLPRVCLPRITLRPTAGAAQ